MTMTALDRALMVGDAGRVTGEQERPDPEVPEKARRRTFTAQYKLAAVAEYDAAPAGEKGAVLRREGLYSSHVTEWRRARDAGALAGPAFFQVHRKYNLKPCNKIQPFKIIL
jgi:transposase